MEEKKTEIQEEEQLNLDELLNVQGGAEENDKGTTHCGLGCYTGGLGKGSKDFTKNDNQQA